MGIALVPIEAKLYKVWKSMRGRCRTTSETNYKYYGGKGVRVCEEWQTYENFRNWALANGYRAGLSIDRVDSDGNYEPANCEWITRSENSRRMVESNIAKRAAVVAA